MVFGEVVGDLFFAPDGDIVAVAVFVDSVGADAPELVFTDIEVVFGFFIACGLDGEGFSVFGFVLAEGLVADIVGGFDIDEWIFPEVDDFVGLAGLVDGVIEVGYGIGVVVF